MWFGTSKWSRSMTIRSRLILLVLAVLIPSIVAALITMAYVYQARERSTEQSLLEMSRVLLLMVDRKMEHRKAFLTMLAVSPALARADLEVFREELVAAAVAARAMVFVYDTTGRPLLGSADLELAVIPPEALEGTRRGPRGNIVTNSYAATDGVPSYAILREVTADGEVDFQIGMIIPLDQFQHILAQLGLPPSWVGVVFDGNGIIVSRTRDPHLHAGQPAHGDLLRALRERSSGVFQMQNRVGVPSYIAFHKADITNWAFMLAVPEREVRIDAWRALGMLGFFAMFLLVLAVLLATWMGHTIVKPMRILTGQAERLGDEEAVSARATGLRETDIVSAAMAQASLQIQNAQRTLEARVAEAVAESKRSQAILLQSQKLEALGRLTGGIAHDFNNLLQTLTLGLQVSELLSTHPDVKKALESCQGAVGRAARLTRQLMAFGKHQVSEAKQMDLRNHLLAMEDLLRGALRRDMTLRLDLAEDLWPVHGDPLQFELAILNLALNARDATQGVGTVLISADNFRARTDEIVGLDAGDYVRLSFRDSGEGMSPEVLERAMNPFFTTKPAGKGSGLGLAQVYGFATQSMGAVRIQSEVGRGTTVVLFLPRSLTADADDPDTSTASPAGPGRTVTVLVVEDDVLVRDVLVPALTAHDFYVITAGDADEALEQFERHPVEIVFSDVVMPGSMNGVRLAEIIRRRRPDMPVVLASGYSEEANIPPGIRMIPKPYEIATVVNALWEALAAQKRG
jgi:signal transduction histidine kinase